MNHNVKLALWWSLLENCSASVRSGDVMSALLWLLTGSNTTVGIVQGINGIAQMVTALPAGWLADRYRRDTLLRWGAGVGAAAGALLAWALAREPAVWALAAAMALLGCYRGVYSAALEAIFADSVAPGRSSVYTHKYALTVAASSCGPWLALLLFRRLGDRWDERGCRTVLLSGVALMAAPLALMCCFDDGRALQQHVQQEQQQPVQQPQQPVQQQQQQQLLRPGSCPGDDSDAPEAAAAADAESGTAGAADTEAAAVAVACTPAASSSGDLVSLLDDTGSGGEALCGCCASWPPGLVVTLLISVSDFLGAFASGMTLRFFALYFVQEVGMGPMGVSLLGALSPLGIATASLACQRLSKPLGRVQISVATRVLDIALLVLLAHLPTSPSSARLALVGVHLVRMAVANATRPLMRSALMDYVPRRHRGKVNAVDSVRTFSWSGSAALGGFLVQRLGFQNTFLVTAALKAAALAPLLPLLAHVPDGVCVGGNRAERLARQRVWHERGRHKHAAGADSLRRPLLASGT